jgi:hypothetical protein
MLKINLETTSGIHVEFNLSVFLSEYNSRDFIKMSKYKRGNVSTLGCRNI